jgi:hypothetical protein
MFFDALRQEFRRSRCSSHFVDQVKLLFRMQWHNYHVRAHDSAGIAAVL